MEKGVRTAIGMSGGVDSSAAAWLLQEQGYEVVGVTMQLFCSQTPGGCGASDSVRDARAVAERLGIAHHVLQLEEEFSRCVMTPFVCAYERGETPNPCVECNRSLKFGAMLRMGEELGWEKTATGHYVRLEQDGGTGRWLLKRATHREKDQSYVLWGLDQQQLSRSLFPLGGLSKTEVRQIAMEQGFVNARKAESQDICFVPDGDYAAFIRRYTGRDYPAGPFVDEQGRVLGVHEGIIAYTVGQRRGLGVSSNHGRLYVKQVRPRDNTVVLSENSSLFSSVLEADGVNLIACARLDGPVRLAAKVRYRMQEQPCTVWQTGENAIRVTFDAPQRAITPGQSVVLYDGETVVGGGVIRRTVD